MYVCTVLVALNETSLVKIGVAYLCVDDADSQAVLHGRVASVKIAEIS